MKRDTFLLIGGLAQFTLFIPVTVWAVKHRQPPVEIAITRFTQKKQSSLSLHIVQAINNSLCSSVSSNILVVPIATLLWKRQRKFEAIATLATNWLSQIVKMGLKRVVSRPRPSFLLVHTTKPRDKKSFPSGDVISSVTLWGWLLALALRSKDTIRPVNVIALSIPAFLLAFVGPARVYMGDHWATDVLGGYLFGGGWVCLSLYMYTQWQHLNSFSRIL